MSEEREFDPAKVSICSICGEEFTGFGNNAWPVNEGRCCDECNGVVVIPARLGQLPRDGQRRTPR